MKKSALTLAFGLAVAGLATAADAPFYGKEDVIVTGQQVNETTLKDNLDGKMFVAGFANGAKATESEITLVESSQNTLSIAKDTVFTNTNNPNLFAGFATAGTGKSVETVRATQNTLIFDGQITNTTTSSNNRYLIAGQATGNSTTKNVVVENNALILKNHAQATKNRLHGAYAVAYAGNVVAQNNQLTIENKGEAGTQNIKATYLSGARVDIQPSEKAQQTESIQATLSGNAVDVAGTVAASGISASTLTVRGKSAGNTGFAFPKAISADIANNTVTIRSGADVQNATISGAFVEYNANRIANLNVSIHDNTVSVERGANVAGSSFVATNLKVNGAAGEENKAQFTYANNTLNIEGAHRIANVQNFQTVNVALNQKDIDANGVVFTNDNFAEQKTAINVHVDAANLKDKNIIQVVQKEENEALNLRVTSGFADVNGGFNADGIFVANGALTGSQESSILTSAMAANATFLQQGTDLLLSHDFKDGAFVALGGGKTEYDVADLSVDGFNTAFGYSFGWDSAKGDRMNIAAFVEYADGSYDATNGAKAEGDTSYYGVGLFGRHAFQNGFTGTMSVRFGRADGDFSSLMMNDAVKFDTESNYVTAHIGGEYAVKLSDNLTVSPFAQYRFAHLGSDNVSAKGYNIELESFTSHRTLVGAAMSGALSTAANYRVSLAWEHEFDGEGKARQNGVALQTLDLGGDAAVIDASVHCAPSTMQGWDFGVGIQGRVGDSDGIAGRFTTTYKF